MRPGAPIRRLAIVNRGEAAMRCIRAVKALRAEEGSDLQAIALYTAADRMPACAADSALQLPSERGAVAAYRPRWPARRCAARADAA
jgi:biotin carboxylase